MIRRPPRSTLSSSSAASDVYKRQIARSTSSRSPDAEITRTCMSGNSCSRISVHVAPSGAGICRSITSTSGRVARARRSASSPMAAVATIRNPAASRSSDIASIHTGWSSTSITRGPSGSVISTPRLDKLLDRNPQFPVNSAPRRGANDCLPTEVADPSQDGFTHADVAALPRLGDVLRLGPDAVVPQGDDQLSALVLEEHPRPRGRSGVLGDVGEDLGHHGVDLERLAARHHDPFGHRGDGDGAALVAVEHGGDVHVVGGGLVEAAVEQQHAQPALLLTSQSREPYAARSHPRALALDEGENLEYAVVNDPVEPLTLSQTTRSPRTLGPAPPSKRAADPRARRCRHREARTPPTSSTGPARTTGSPRRGSLRRPRP